MLEGWQSRDSVLGIRWSVMLGQYCSSAVGDTDNNTAQPVRCGGGGDGVCSL